MLVGKEFDATYACELSSKYTLRISELIVLLPEEIKPFVLFAVLTFLLRLYFTLLSALLKLPPENSTELLESIESTYTLPPVFCKTSLLFLWISSTSSPTFNAERSTDSASKNEPFSKVPSKLGDAL